MIKARYPQNWNAIATAQKAAAHWTCQACNKQCIQPGESLTTFITRTGYNPTAVHAHPRQWLLTVAHPNQDPENPNARLIAWCTVCHLRYDRRFRAKQQTTKREWFGQLNLLEVNP